MALWWDLSVVVGLGICNLVGGRAQGSLGLHSPLALEEGIRVGDSDRQDWAL